MPVSACEAGWLPMTDHAGPAPPSSAPSHFADLYMHWSGHSLPGHALATTFDPASALQEATSGHTARLKALKGGF